MTTMYQLVYATDEETTKYENSNTFSGLDSSIDYLRQDPLARKELTNTKGMDHIHLSISSSNKKLVRWTGRSSNGYHYPIGTVMKMVKK